MNREARRNLMRRFKSKDTKPELLVRSALHAAGLRFRLNRRDLPGRPDIVLPRRKMAIFVHGCFWHAHEGCSIARIPKTNPDFWREKFEGNRVRDFRSKQDLEALGWEAFVVWECEIKGAKDINNLLREKGLPLPISDLVSIEL